MCLSMDNIIDLCQIGVLRTTSSMDLISQIDVLESHQSHTERSSNIHFYFIYPLMLASKISTPTTLVIVSQFFTLEYTSHIGNPRVLLPHMQQILHSHYKQSLLSLMDEVDNPLPLPSGLWEVSLPWESHLEQPPPMSHPSPHEEENQSMNHY